MFTGRYSNPNVATSGLVPVGITRYPPRFRLAYEVRANLFDLAPTAGQLARWRAGNMTSETFRVEYARMLASLGADRIVATLRAMQGAEAGVVLLCFEDVTVGEHCHRRDLADWLKREVGIEMHEIADAGRAGKRPPVIHQERLF